VWFILTDKVKDDSKMTLQEIYNELIMPVDTNIKLSSVILSDVNKDKIRDFVNEINNREKLAKYGLRPMNRLLFYGASGCGKTFLGKALSNHLKYKMLYVDIAQALAKGNAAINIANIFRIANTGKFIVFLDEVDSIAWDRDSKNAEAGDIRRATNSLFQQMDQMKPQVIVIAATNMLHRLDPAFERRFDLKLEFKRPDMPIKDAVEKFLHPAFRLIVDRHDPITERRSKLSFAELEGVTERLMKRAVMEDRTEITMTEVYIEVARAMNVKISFGTDTDEFYKTL